MRFFAASTLLQKLSRAWATLPDAAHQQLKSSLLSWLARSAALAYPQAGAGRPGERMVMRKLAAAATSLSLQLAGWDDWLLEVVMRVAAGDSASGGAPLREAVLDVLSVAIEQVNRAELAGPKRCASPTLYASDPESQSSVLCHARLVDSPRRLDPGVIPVLVLCAPGDCRARVLRRVPRCRPARPHRARSALPAHRAAALARRDGRRSVRRRPGDH